MILSALEIRIFIDRPSILIATLYLIFQNEIIKITTTVKRENVLSSWKKGLKISVKKQNYGELIQLFRNDPDWEQIEVFIMI